MKQPIQISIPQPCHEDWDEMTPTEQGRFCNSCQKCVVDFTTLNDQQLYEFLDKHRDQYICGRTSTCQLNRDIRPIYTYPKHGTHKFLIILSTAIVIAALPSVSLFAKVPYSIEIYEQTDADTSAKEVYELSGIVRDSTLEPLIGAFIEISHNGTICNTQATDEEGRYSVQLKSGTYTVKTTYFGFLSETTIVNLSDRDVKTITTMRENHSLLDTIITSGKIVINTKTENTIAYPDGTERTLKHETPPTMKPNFWQRITNWLK